MKKTLLFLLLSGSLFSLKAQQGKQAIMVTDMTKIKQINSASFSHSGKQIAFRVTSIVPDEEKKSRIRIP